MSIQAVGWALEQEIPALGPKLVLVVLANHADHSSGLCWPSIKLIAHEASCSPRAVYRYIADLTRNGYVAAERKRGKDGKHRSNNYWLCFDRLPLPWSAVPVSHAQDAEVESSEDQEIVAEVHHDDEPTATLSPGEDATENAVAEAMTPGVNDKPGDRESHGPCATAGTPKSLPEPSSVEPSPRASLRAAAVPARYDASIRPSARASAAAEEARRRSKPVFVIAGTRAYRAWQDHKTLVWNRKIIRDGKVELVKWNAETWATIDGKNVRGWWFPTLFPPSGSDLSRGSLSDDDSRELAKL